MRQTFIAMGICCAIGISTLACQDKSKDYTDPTLPVSERVSSLMSQMTLEEKVAQMCQYVGLEHMKKAEKDMSAEDLKHSHSQGFYPNLHSSDVEEMTKKGMIGSFLHVVKAEEANYLQSLAQQSRLKIPLLIGIDAIHGNGLYCGSTIYPTPIGQAATFDPALVERMSRETAIEMRASGMHWTFTPNVEVARDARWGRVGETFGEDPYLTSEMVVPFIKAVQDGGVIATIKHFAANDQEFDRYTVSTEVSERALQEIYLPPFKAAVQKAGVKAVMTGYNLVNGIHCTENKHLIDILKKDWGFKGMLMSDWACTYSADNAANYGLDLEMGSNDWFTRKELLPLIKEGKVTEEVINDKVRRIYGACISMGFFDRPQQDTHIPTFNPQANQMALNAACEGIILLKNEQNTLPIRQPKVIAVIGPTANPRRCCRALPAKLSRFRRCTPH